MTLLPDATYTVGSFTSQVKNGNLLLSPDVDQFYTNGAPGPFSLLHLAAGTNNAQQQSFRPWMRTGISFTGNGDHGYIGQKNGSAVDDTDMIIHWSDNPGFVAGPDRLRFIFTSGYNVAAPTGAPTGASVRQAEQRVA